MLTSGSEVESNGLMSCGYRITGTPYPTGLRSILCGYTHNSSTNFIIMIMREGYLDG